MLCSKCGLDLPADRFYASITNACKECFKQRVRDNYYRNRDRFVAYERERAQRPERKEAALEYQRTRRRRYPEKNYARNAVSNAIRDGALRRLPCEVCGDPAAEAHHDDYSKPLEVRWLCFRHHREEHGQIVTLTAVGTQQNEGATSG